MKSAPLAGKRIMITRSRSQAGELAERIKQLGGEAFEFPVIKIVPPSDWSQVDAALHEIQSYDWILFTSANGITFFFDRMEQLGIRRSEFRGKFAVVGSKTALALEAEGVEADLVPKEFSADSLLAEMSDQLIPGQRILLPRANIARKMLPLQLREFGCDVTELDIYANVPDCDHKADALLRLQNGAIDCITFTSSSTVSNFCRIFADNPLDEWLRNVTIACIGPITADTAASKGLHVEVMPETYTIAGMVEALVAKYNPSECGQN